MTIYETITGVHQAIREAVETRFGARVVSIEATTTTRYASILMAAREAYLMHIAILSFRVIARRGNVEVRCEISVTGDGTLVLDSATSTSLP